MPHRHKDYVERINPIEPVVVDELEQARDELDWLDKKISECTGWGAALGAMDERARSLRSYIETESKKQGK